MSTGTGPLAGALADAALLVAPPTAVGTTTSEVVAQAEVRVMPLGDSITDGVNVPGGYRVDLWQKIVASGRTVDFVGSQTNGPGSLGDRDHEGHWDAAVGAGQHRRPVRPTAHRRHGPERPYNGSVAGSGTTAFGSVASGAGPAGVTTPTCTSP